MENENTKSYPPSSFVLGGLSLQRAECFGKPGIGARYHYRNGMKSVYGSEEKTGCECAICGRQANNIHHWPPKGYAHIFSMRTAHGMFTLCPALFLLCGSGTMGCHGDWHNGLISAEWIWDDERCAELWWNGTLLYHFGAYSPKLYRFGFWKITTQYGEITYREYAPDHEFEMTRVFCGVI